MWVLFPLSISNKGYLQVLLELEFCAITANVFVVSYAPDRPYFGTVTPSMMELDHKLKPCVCVCERERERAERMYGLAMKALTWWPWAPESRAEQELIR